MIKTIGFWEFSESFSGSYKGNFSFGGKRALFDYLEEYENETGKSVEFDPIALCCDYAEYDSAEDAMREYQPADMPTEGEDGDDLLEVQAKNEKAAHEWLEERTQVIDVEGGKVIIARF